MQRPQAGEYNPFFQGYIDRVPEGDFPAILQENTLAAIRFFESMPADKQDYRYAPDKWTIKELLIHIIDAERVFSYRALVAARGDNKTPLHPMDDHMYVRNAEAARRKYADVVAEFKAVRGATERLFESMSEEQGTFAADAVSAPITARALGYIIVGHMMHHLSVIQEKYL
jgi:uncharacterized damage-inducible protein DinB